MVGVERVVAVMAVAATAAVVRGAARVAVKEAVEMVGATAEAAREVGTVAVAMVAAREVAKAGVVMEVAGMEEGAREVVRAAGATEVETEEAVREVAMAEVVKEVDLAVEVRVEAAPVAVMAGVAMEAVMADRQADGHSRCNHSRTGTLRLRSSLGHRPRRHRCCEVRACPPSESSHHSTTLEGSAADSEVAREVVAMAAVVRVEAKVAVGMVEARAEGSAVWW